MITFTTTFNVLLSLGVIVYGVLILIALTFKKEVRPFVQKYSMPIIFAVSFVATVSSLVYSNIIGFPPCDLCWYQRVFLYSLFFISLLALIRKESFFVLRPYMLLLTVTGGIISLYHNAVYYGGYNPLPCSATASCTARYVFEFGFITIPLMALMSLLVILLVLMMNKKTK